MAVMEVFDWAPHAPTPELPAEYATFSPAVHHAAMPPSRANHAHVSEYPRMTSPTPLLSLTAE
jgi:hypothetical protein